MRTQACHWRYTVRQAMCTSKELTAFEFLFGLGKSWAEKFPCLKFASKNEDDEVN